MVIHVRCTIASPNPVPLMVRALSPEQTAGTGAYVVPAQFPDRHLHLEPGAIRLRSAADFDPAIA